jgi:CrcB protein
MAQADNSYTLCRENSIVNEQLGNLLVISLGAIFGANARYLISRYSVRLIGSAFPWGTLFINVVGSAILDPRWRLLVVVGFCGAFTTFSSYAFESMALFEQGQWQLMAANVLASNLLCLMGAVAGMALARVL